MELNFFINNAMDAKKFYMYSAGAGIYCVDIDIKSLNSACFSRFEKKIKNQRSEYLTMSVSNYVKLSREKQEVIKLCKGISNMDIAAYSSGYVFEFDMRFKQSGNTTNAIFSKDSGMNYWISFLAGIIDSNKSYILYTEELDNYYLDIMLDILNYLEFKYKTIYIDSRYLQILTKNPYCKISEL